MKLMTQEERLDFLLEKFRAESPRYRLLDILESVYQWADEQMK